MITAQVVAELIRAGVTGDALVDALRRIEQTSPVSTALRPETPFVDGETPSVTAAALRQRRWRERKASQKPPVNNGGQSTVTSPAPSLETGGYIDKPSLSTNSEGKKEVVARPPSTTVSPTSGAYRWDAFKSTYPKRAGDYDWKKARAKYEKLVASGISEQTLIDGARRYALFCTAEGKTGTQFVRQPPTWLNNEGWKNDYTPSPPPANGFNNAFASLERRFAGDGGPDDGAGRMDPADNSDFPL